MGEPMHRCRRESKWKQDLTSPNRRRGVHSGHISEDSRPDTVSVKGSLVVSKAAENVVLAALYSLVQVGRDRGLTLSCPWRPH
jgi:hypothetical protein